MNINRRKALLTASIGLGTSLTASAVYAPFVQAKERLNLRMVTSWGRNTPGPGTTAQRIAERIEALSSGTINIELFAAGELTSAFGVFDAVSQGIADLGHSASFFQAGKHKAATLFTTLPFGMGPKAHNAWIAQGGGQALWDEIYADFKVKPYLAGNSDATMGGWHKKPLSSVQDFKGLKMRVAGLGAQIYAAMGAVVVTLPPSEIFRALSGPSLDAVEFLGPFSDQAAGFPQAANYYYWPGFNKPNGSAEGLISQKTLAHMTLSQRAIIETAFEQENYQGLCEAAWYNAKALEEIRRSTVLVQRFPDAIIQEAQSLWHDIKADWRDKNPEVTPALQSYEAAASSLGDWTALQA